MSISRALLCCAIALGVQAAGAEPRDALGEGDTVRITVFQHPDLTTEARISAQGSISFPLIGEVELRGLEPAAAEARIARKLIDGDFLLKPQVNLSVVNVRSRQVSVLGQVVRPGRYPLDGAAAKLTEVLALAGGIGPGGDDNVIVMTQREGGPRRLDIDVPYMYRTGDLTRDIELVNGDIVFVQRAPVFYIYGEVQRAGAYRLEPGMTVMQALSLGGGVTPRGTERGMKISRRTPEGEVRRINAALTDRLQADDVIHVQESWF
ncbi:MAG TPA: polysaccharide export protein EpsE [Burkholderiales bacterium]